MLNACKVEHIRRAGRGLDGHSLRQPSEARGCRLDMVGPMRSGWYALVALWMTASCSCQQCCRSPHASHAPPK